MENPNDKDYQKLKLDDDQKLITGSNDSTMLSFHSWGKNPITIKHNQRIIYHHDNSSL